jgi:hypothetical protein
LFFAKATAAMHQSPESNHQDWLLQWVLVQATAAMHRSSESNRQDWFLLRASSLGPWPSDGCDAPIFLIQPSGLVSTPRFRSLGKPRLRCTDLPNPTVRIGIFGSLTKRRLRCTNLPKPNGQGLASSTTRMLLLVLAKVTAAMHQFFQNQPPGCTHVWQWIGYLHIAPFVLEKENSFSPPEFKFCSLSSNYFYLFTGQILIKNLFTHNLPGGRVFSPRELGTHILPGGRVFVLRELGTHILPKGRVFLLRSIQPRLLYAKFIFSPFSFRHLHLQGDGYLFWGG